MDNEKSKLAISVGNVLLWSVVGVAAAALAQEPEVDGERTADGEEIDEIITIGTRRAARSATDIPVAVDVIDSEALLNQGHNSILQMLRTEVPSFNVLPAPVGGTSSHTLPPNFRAMSPDHLLVLINGKRRHRSADIPTNGPLVVGSQGADIGSIPAIAIKQVEVLRDGAAAQYGADAISGVFNFVLDDTAEGGRVEAKVGQYTAGDGQAYSIAGTYGVPLGRSGFVRVSGEFSESDMTDRSAPSLAQRQMAEAGNLAGMNEIGSTGNPEVRDNIKSFINMAVDVGAESELYGFGTYAERASFTNLSPRTPWSKIGVYTTSAVPSDGIQYRLVGDLTPNDAEACPGTVAGGGLVPASAAEADDRALREALLQLPNCFSWYEILPSGYAARFGADVSDAAGTLGLRGTKFGWNYDASAGFGHSALDFNMSNVPSPSFGRDNVPTAFDDVGGREQNERIFNLDFSRGFEVGLASPLNIAVGTQWHEERFRVTLGEQETWGAGPLSDQGFSSGTDVYFGYGPTSVGEWSRNGKSVYVDLESDVTERLLLNLAARYEDFSDLGSELIYKVAGRLQVTDSFAFRAAASTGFHPPTPAQVNFTYADSEWQADGTILEKGIIPATNPVAQQLGAVAPVPESSENYSYGLVFENDRLSITLDYFDIEMEDRITLSSRLPITAEQRQQLIDGGLTGADQFTLVSFFTNDFNTTTTGFDLVALMPLDIGTGDTNISLSINRTDTEVTEYSSLTGEDRVFALEEGTPGTRAFFNVNHIRDKFSIFTRVSFWESTTWLLADDVPLETGDAVTVDFEASYQLTDAVELTFGGENILDEYPVNHYSKPLPNVRGLQYPRETPYGVNGAYLYGSVQYRF